VIEAQPTDIAELDVSEVHSLPPFEQIEHGQVFSLSLSNNTIPLTHGLHRFPAKYIPQVPAWALDNFAAHDATVLDPFMGSGTTLVEGLLRGGTHIGLDIDPLARLIARAKTTDVDAERIRDLGELLRSSWTSPAAKLRTPMAGVQNFSHWFSLRQWAWVQSLHQAILELPCIDKEREFLLAVFSSTLRWVSNADDQSQKTYVSGTLQKRPPPVQDVFWRFFHRSASGLADLNLKRHSEATAVIPDDGDATAITVGDRSVDLAITSPPYLDSVDYMYNMMLEYFWLGPHLGVPDRETFNQMRRAHVGAKNPAEQLKLPEAIEGLIHLESLPAARQVAASAYFALMDRHFHEVARCLKTGSRYVFVVGNSQSLAGVLPMHEALIQLAVSAGLSLERGFGYRIRRHYMKFPRAGRGGIILVDWVLVFQKKRSRTTVQPLPLPWVTLAPDAVAH
jgi:hypothetical protein